MRITGAMQDEKQHQNNQVNQVGHYYFLNTLSRSEYQRK